MALSRRFFVPLALLLVLLSMLYLLVWWSEIGHKVVPKVLGHRFKDDTRIQHTARLAEEDDKATKTKKTPAEEWFWLLFPG